MKTFILTAMLALTAVSGVVVASQSAQALPHCPGDRGCWMPPTPPGGCGSRLLCSPPKRPIGFIYDRLLPLPPHGLRN
jgi:hypothetical protein